MPQVYRIDQEKKVSIFISDLIWKKIQKKPNVFGGKWELAPQPTPRIHKKNIAKKAPIISYDEKDYREDLKNARLSLKAGDKEKAFGFYKRAYKFKESLYVRTKIKELS